MIKQRRIYVDYGLASERHDENYKLVVRENPLGDPEISALVYDVFCLFHSYDWAESGDTSRDAYQRDVAIFKDRWFKKARKDRIKEMIDISTEKLKEELYQAFGFEPESSSEPRVQ